MRTALHGAFVCPGRNGLPAKTFSLYRQAAPHGMPQIEYDWEMNELTVGGENRDEYLLTNQS